jgi:hypothetical protein
MVEAAVQKENDSIPIPVKWLERFLPIAQQISIFGGSITFTVVVSNRPPHDFNFQQREVITFLSLAWLFFALALGLASIADMLLTTNRDYVIKIFNSKEGYSGEVDRLKGGAGADLPVLQPTPPGTFSRDWRVAKGKHLLLWIFLRFPLSLTIQILILVAFLFLSLVIVAYREKVGFIAVAFTGLFIFMAVVAWVWQVTSRGSSHGNGGKEASREMQRRGQNPANGDDPEVGNASAGQVRTTH